jgi:hypothetical protein
MEEMLHDFCLSHRGYIFSYLVDGLSPNEKLVTSLQKKSLQHLNACCQLATKLLIKHGIKTVDGSTQKMNSAIIFIYFSI